MNFEHKICTYVIKGRGKDTYKAYIPPKLPPDPPLRLERLYSHIDQATHAVAELNHIARDIPNKALFIYIYVRKEALLSSQIEGTQSSFSDLILFEHQQKPHVSISDVEEVSNYVAAIHYGLKRLNEGFPFSLRLLREIHTVLLRGGRGAEKQPGEFRNSQNWIGGTRPGNALFVPPPPEHLMSCLGDLEKFLHDESAQLPLLVKAGLVHVQFETIHPFLDGNGRLGRLLITLILCEKGLLTEPLLYLSLYLKQNRDLYYDLLQQVRLNGTWETWLEFFLDGVRETAERALVTTEQMNKLFEADINEINTLGRARFSCLKTLEYLKQLPQITVSQLAQSLSISIPTARASLDHLLNLGILREISGKKRDKIYLYKKYLDLLEEGATPLRRS